VLGGGILLDRQTFQLAELIVLDDSLHKNNVLLPFLAHSPGCTLDFLMCSLGIGREWKSYIDQ